MTIYRRFSTRMDGLFKEARRLALEDIRQSRAAMSAQGSLASGATIKSAVRITETRAGAAVDEALRAIENGNLLIPGREARLRSEVRHHLVQFMLHDATVLVPETVGQGPAANSALRSLLLEAEGRLNDKIAQHATRLDRPRPTWIARHPAAAHAVGWSFSFLALLISIWSAFFKQP